jgi:xanthine dehydrogenase YagR molybdenum-binding subunit
VVLGDTDLPHAGNSIGQASAGATSSAVHLAAQGLVRRLAAMAVAHPRSPLHGADTEPITARDGSLVHPDGRSDSFGEILNRAALLNLDIMSEWDPASGVAIVGGTERHIPLRLNSAFSHGAWFVIVAVDPDFGLVRVRRLAEAFAAGRILNEKAAISQIRGGAIMGIGQALLEGTVTDPCDGEDSESGPQ